MSKLIFHPIVLCAMMAYRVCPVEKKRPTNEYELKGLMEFCSNDHHRTHRPLDTCVI